MRNVMMGIMFGLLPVAALAGGAVVEQAIATKSGEAWRFDVTISHGDTGWDHYADGWGVYLEDGTELGYRVLAHPHVNEQPFTRSLAGVVVPSGVSEVFVIARDKVHGVAKARFPVALK